MKPNRRFIRRWVAALRSGKHKQSGGQLRDADGFCCLGVACNISRKVRFDADSLFYESADDDVAFGTFPFQFGAWVGINLDEQMVLASMNDHGKPFSAIADYIEAKYL